MSWERVLEIKGFSQAVRNTRSDWVWQTAVSAVSRVISKVTGSSTNQHAVSALSSHRHPSNSVFTEHTS